MKISFKEFDEIYALGEHLVRTAQRSQVTYAIETKFLNKNKSVIKNAVKRLNEKRSDLEAEHCLKDEKGAFIESEVKVNNQVVFRKKFDLKGQRAIEEAMNQFRQELDLEDVEIEPYIIETPPASEINLAFVIAFSGIIFKPMTEEQQQTWYLG